MMKIIKNKKKNNQLDLKLEIKKFKLKITIMYKNFKICLNLLQMMGNNQNLKSNCKIIIMNNRHNKKDKVKKIKKKLNHFFAKLKIIIKL